MRLIELKGGGGERRIMVASKVGKERKREKFWRLTVPSPSPDAIIDFLLPHTTLPRHDCAGELFGYDGEEGKGLPPPSHTHRGQQQVADDTPRRPVNTFFSTWEGEGNEWRWAAGSTSRREEEKLASTIANVTGRNRGVVRFFLVTLYYYQMDISRSTYMY